MKRNWAFALAVAVCEPPMQRRRVDLYCRAGDAAALLIPDGSCQDAGQLLTGGRQQATRAQLTRRGMRRRKNVARALHLFDDCDGVGRRPDGNSPSSGPNTVRRLPRRLRTAASVSDRVGAVASFHGGLVTDHPNSPHLQAAKSKAQFLVAIAASDPIPARIVARLRTEKKGRGGKTVTLVCVLAPEPRIPEEAQSGIEAGVRHGRHGGRWRRRIAGRPSRPRARRPETHLGSLAVQFVMSKMGLVPGGSRDTGIRNRCPFVKTSYGLLWFTAVRPV